MAETDQAIKPLRLDVIEVSAKLHSALTRNSLIATAVATGIAAYLCFLVWQATGAGSVFLFVAAAGVATMSVADQIVRITVEKRGTLVGLVVQESGIERNGGALLSWSALFRFSASADAGRMFFDPDDGEGFFLYRAAPSDRPLFAEIANSVTAAVRQHNPDAIA